MTDVTLTATEVEVLRLAHRIGSTSYDGDSWYAKHYEHIDYDDAEAAMADAWELIKRLATEAGLDDDPA